MAFRVVLTRIRDRRLGKFLAIGLVAFSLLCLAGMISASSWLPGLIRQVVPHSYIVAYAPDPVREFVFSRDYETLPTIAPAERSSEDLIEGIVSITQAPTATVAPTVAGTPEFTPTPSVTPEPPMPDQVFLTGATLVGQGWNRCGPTTLSMNLSYWGVQVDMRTQEEISEVIKPEYEDKNTSPDELVAYAESQGFAGFHRVNGTIDLLRRLIYAGYPVMIERGFDELPEEGWMGHYMLLIGYSDTERTFAALDSYWTLKHNHADPEHPMDLWDYDEIDRLWRQFGWTYVVIVPPDEEDRVAAIIGDDMDDTAMYYGAAQRLSAELEKNTADVFGWFSLGEVLVGLKDYSRAAKAFDQARAIGLPFRMLWYQFGPYEAYYQTGEYQTVLDLAAWTLYDYPVSEEAYYYRGLVFEAQENPTAAKGQYQKALSIKPGYEAAQIRLNELQP